eukprot:scaffold6237_cov336-Prasinococcus_capsulatus_cf.AAC.9
MGAALRRTLGVCCSPVNRYAYRRATIPAYLSSLPGELQRRIATTLLGTSHSAWCGVLPPRGRSVHRHVLLASQLLTKQCLVTGPRFCQRHHDHDALRCRPYRAPTVRTCPGRKQTPGPAEATPSSPPGIWRRRRYACGQRRCRTAPHRIPPPREPPASGRSARWRR